MGLHRSYAIPVTIMLALILLYASPASSQPGFLNIDCGSPKNYSDYYFNWVTDTGYISTGYNSGPVFGGDFSDFRLFNDSRKKHCYTLPTQPDTTYLVRASFLYGNFSELYGNITFDLTINSTYWTTITIQPVVNWNDDNVGVLTILRREVTVRSNGTKMYMCLLRKVGLPFITSLQLRTFADNMYEEVKNNQILVTNSRWQATVWDSVRYMFTLSVDPSYTAPEDVIALQFLLSSLRGIGDWNGDPCKPVPWEWLTCNDALPARVIQLKLSDLWLNGTISPNITGLTELTDVWLDNNRIHGNIPDLGALQNLVTVHLQNNSLDGPIPSSFGTLTGLQELFVQNNNLSGEIPPALLAPRNGVKFSFVYDGNEYLQNCLPDNGPCLPVSPSNSSAPAAAPAGGGGGVNPALIAGIVAGAAGVFIAFIFFYCCCIRKSPKAAAVAAKKGGVWGEDGSQQLQARVFSIEDIATMTQNFNKKLGQGSFGPVYYGRTADGQEVAVKVNAADSSQGTEEFVNEVVLLSRVHHKYLVSLVGYCEAPQQHILVYAFMPNGTLTEHLHGDRAKTNPLTWLQRLEIALNAAQGLEYLHTFCNPPIIHRDIKPSNILLDNNLMAKVADFGMSKSAPEESRTGFSTAVKGTFGYLDPEYLSGWRLTTKSDVYSFGVILLELITGRKPTSIIHFADGTQGNFMGWARSAQKNGDVQSIVDPDLDGNFNPEAMWRVADMAFASISSEGVDRPDMGEIVRGVMEAIKLENPNVKNNDQRSKDFDSARTSYSATIPLRSQPSYSSVGSYDTDMSQYQQPR
ncbi:hypothetical protein R1flu_026084 [Riccia fluitans]|uniref:non-specific serine/threonine protein kinase n=1 Tax=Riccia fluitans TaxID=41844 RepID=A0ABD1XHY9_9MARC